MHDNVVSNLFAVFNAEFGVLREIGLGSEGHLIVRSNHNLEQVSSLKLSHLAISRTAPS